LWCVTLNGILIIGRLSRKEGESAEHLKRLQEELQKVKTDLSNTEGKMQYLENELEHVTKAKEVASESCLKAKQDVLTNFGELVETELQCSICSELFVSVSD
jgi:E3 ubiquitin-protein ligase RNF8